MYRLMKSEKTTLNHDISGSMSSYRQIEVDHFQQFCTALEACNAANKTGIYQYYVLNDSGQEYFNETWIDWSTSIRDCPVRCLPPHTKIYSSWSTEWGKTLHTPTHRLCLARIHVAVYLYAIRHDRIEPDRWCLYGYIVTPPEAINNDRYLLRSTAACQMTR